MNDSISDYFERGNKTPSEADCEWIDRRITCVLIEEFLAAESVVSCRADAEYLANLVFMALERGDIPNVRIEY